MSIRLFKDIVFIASFLFPFFSEASSQRITPEHFQINEEEKSATTVMYCDTECSEENSFSLSVSWEEGLYDSTLQELNLNNDSQVLWSSFVFPEEKFDQMIYLDTGWGIIIDIPDDVSELPIKYFYTRYLYDCVGIGIIEKNPNKTSKRVGLLHRDHSHFLDKDSTDLTSFLEKFDPKFSEVILVSGWASQHLKFIKSQILESSFIYISVDYFPKICLSNGSKFDRHYILPERPSSFDFSEGFHQLGICLESDNWFCQSTIEIEEWLQKKDMLGDIKSKFQILNSAELLGNLKNLEI